MKNSFAAEVASRIEANATNELLQAGSRDFMRASFQAQYSYNFAWLGRPVIQYPQDLVAMQEIIWRIRPDLIIETGIAHGGSLIMSASMMALLDYCDAVESGRVLDPAATRRRVLGVDIDIRQHNREAIQAHPMAHRIDMIQGSSINPEIIRQVYAAARGYERVLVCLDSNHTHTHVLAELEAYAPLASRGSYCCVFDTVVEDLPDSMSDDRPWGNGDNPKTAVWEYLRGLKTGAARGVDGARLDFEIDTSIQNKLQITVAPDGYLRRI